MAAIQLQVHAEANGIQANGVHAASTAAVQAATQVLFRTITSSVLHMFLLGIPLP